MKTRHLVTAVITTAVALSPGLAFAAGGSMPWDNPLSTLGTNLTGPTASALALIAAFAAVLGLVFGGELSGWIRGALVACIGMAFLVGLTSFASALGITVGGMVG